MYRYCYFKFYSRDKIGKHTELLFVGTLPKRFQALFFQNVWRTSKCISDEKINRSGNIRQTERSDLKSKL